VLSQGTQQQFAEKPKAVVVNDLHKSFGPLEVLKGVSLVAREGDVVSMIGASGSGKSTFLRCINFLEMPTRGQIIVNGEEISLKSGRDGNMQPTDNRQVERIRTRLGMVFQSFNLWQHMTVLQNVVEAPVHVLKVPRAEATERAEKLLQRVGLYEKKDQYSNNLQKSQKLSL
jgi:octopine/nopaline transport system ATP-binding protein